MSINATSTSRPSLGNLTNLSRETERLENTKAVILGKSSDNILTKIAQLPKDEGAFLMEGYSYLGKIFTGYYNGTSLKSNAIDKESLIKVILFYEKSLTHNVIKENYSTMLKFCALDSLIIDMKIISVFTDFQRKYLNEPESDVNFRFFESDFFIDAEYLSNTELLNGAITEDVVDSFKLEVATKRAGFIHNLFKPFSFNQSAERFIQKYIPKKLSKTALFSSFLANAKIKLVDVKLKSMEDPLFERKILEDFNAYIAKFPFLSPPQKKEEQSQRDKLALLCEALKTELEEESTQTKSKAKKRTPNEKLPKTPLKSHSNVEVAETAPRPLSITPSVRPISRQQAQSPEWKKVEPTKKTVEASPTNTFRKIVSFHPPLHLKERVLRWKTIQNLIQVKQFQDFLLQGSGKTSVKRYEKMEDTEIFIQVARHFVPSLLLPVLASPDFRKLYCFCRDNCLYVKVQITIPSINLSEETIASFAVNNQNQLYHFFIHPKEEIQFNTELSNIPKASDTTQEDVAFGSILEESLQEIISFEFENTVDLGIATKYQHPVDKSPIQLLLIPRN